MFKLKSLAVAIALAALSACGKPDVSGPSAPDPGPGVQPTPRPASARAFPMGYGYWRAISKYGDDLATVRCYTDTVHLGFHDFLDGDWNVDFPAIEDAMRKSKAAGFKIIYEMHSDPKRLERMIAAAAPSWDAVIAVDAVDEPSTKNLHRWLLAVRDEIARQGLDPRPIGVTSQYNVVARETIGYTEGLDWIGVEGYIEPGQFGHPIDNRRILREHLDAAIGNVPASVDILLVGMGYSRNFGITDIEALAKTQDDTFEYAQENDRVLGISWFSYNRPSGTKDYPPLQEAHKRHATALGINTCGR